jgi:hypothetical protein
MRIFAIAATTLLTLACGTNSTTLPSPTNDESSTIQKSGSNWIGMYRADGARIGGLIPAHNTFQHPGAPTVTTWLHGSDIGRTADGERIVGVRFTGSHEYFGAMVKVIALALPEGAGADVFVSSDLEQFLKPIDVSTFMLNAGDRVTVRDLAKFGVAPMVVEYEAEPK